MKRLNITQECLTIITNYKDVFGDQNARSVDEEAEDGDKEIRRNAVDRDAAVRAITLDLNLVDYQK